MGFVGLRHVLGGMVDLVVWSGIKLYQNNALLLARFRLKIVVEAAIYSSILISSRFSLCFFLPLPLAHRPLLLFLHLYLGRPFLLG